MVDTKKVLWKDAYHEYKKLTDKVEDVMIHKDTRIDYPDLEFVPIGKYCLAEIYTSATDMYANKQASAVKEITDIVESYRYKGYAVRMNYGYKHTDLARELFVELCNNYITNAGGIFMDIETFIDVVETQDNWDSTDIECYDEAFEKLGFEYKEDPKYEDCDFEWIWQDFKKIALPVDSKVSNYHLVMQLEEQCKII